MDIKKKLSELLKKTKNTETIELEVPVELLVFAINIAKLRITQFLQNSKIAWLNDNFSLMSFDNLCFTYNNNVFSVIIDFQDEHGNSYLSKRNIEKQVLASELYNLIPCKFPVIIKNPFSSDISQIQTEYKDLNLYHTETGETIILQNFSPKEKSEISEWELQNFANQCIMQYLSSTNCKIISSQSILDTVPNINYYDENDQQAWAIVQIFKNNDTNTKDDPKNLKQLIKKNYRNDGYIYKVMINSPDENNKFMYRGDNIRMKLIEVKKVHAIHSIELLGTNIEEENIRDLILKTIGQPDIYQSGKVNVIPISGYSDDYVLKIGSSYVESPENITDDLVMIPILYEDKIKNNPRFGLPLYYIDKKDSNYAQKGYVHPKEIVNINKKNTTITIIRRVHGDIVLSKYAPFFYRMIGGYNNISHMGNIQFQIIVDIFTKYKEAGVIKALDLCKKGAVIAKPNELAEGSEQYLFLDSYNFYVNYQAFIKTFLETLENFSNLPQTTYDLAVKDILSATDFTFDFAHPLNTFINWEKQEFNFIDFIYEQKYIDDVKSTNVLKWFRNILLGLNFTRYHIPTTDKHANLNAKDFLFYPEDIEKFNNYRQIIDEKINNAAPKEYKF